VVWPDRPTTARLFAELPAFVDTVAEEIDTLGGGGRKRRDPKAL
jgi:hypothetical protein